MITSCIRTIAALLVVATLTTTVAGVARADDGPASSAVEHRSGDEEKFRIRLAVDIPIFLFAGVMGMLPAVFNDELGPPHCDPCDASKVGGFDNWVIGRESQVSEALADFMQIGIPLMAIASGLFHYRHGWRAVVTDMLIIAQATILAGATQQLLALAVRRPRPYMYVAGVRPEERNIANAASGFPSGHTALVFAAALSFAYVHTVRDDDWPHWLVWTLATLVAAPMPFLRMLSGEHFPSDVIAGAGVGIAYGLLVPMLHRVSERKSTRVSLQLTAGGAALMGTF